MELCQGCSRRKKKTIFVYVSNIHIVYFHLLSLSLSLSLSLTDTQNHMHAHILTHSYILNAIYLYGDTHKTLYRHSSILSDTLKLAITHNSTPHPHPAFSKLSDIHSHQLKQSEAKSARAESPDVTSGGVYVPGIYSHAR